MKGLALSLFIVFGFAILPGLPGLPGLPDLFALQTQPGPPSSSRVPVYTYRVVHAYPHDVEAFTEGLEYRDGFL